MKAHRSHFLCIIFFSVHNNFRDRGKERETTWEEGLFLLCAFHHLCIAKRFALRCSCQFELIHSLFAALKIHEILYPICAPARALLSHYDELNTHWNIFFSIFTCHRHIWLWHFSLVNFIFFSLLLLLFLRQHISHVGASPVIATIFLLFRTCRWVIHTPGEFGRVRGNAETFFLCSSRCHKR